MDNIFVERLTLLLNKHNMAQKKLAEYINVDESTISRYIKGISVPNCDILSKIAIALNTTPNYLLGFDDNNNLQWIKVTPETMPMSMQSVMVTIKHKWNEQSIYPEARYNNIDYNPGKWEWARISDEDEWVQFAGQVTHWMPLPEPAKN